MRNRAMIVVACAVAILACRDRTRPAPESLADMLRAGKHARALERVRASIEAGHATDEERDLEVALLAWDGRSPEAMDAYAARIADGLTPDALLLEAIVLSSYPPQVRLDPALLVDEARRPAFGTATAAAVDRLLGEELKGQVPSTRLADLVGLIAYPGNDGALDAIDRFVDQKTEPAVRMTALMGLARIGTPAAVERLEGIATRFSVSNIMLRNLLDVLAEMPDARPDLAARLLDDRTERVRARAAGVLAHSRSGAADGLLAASGAVEARFALMARQSAPEGTMQDLEAHVRSLETPLAKARLLDVLREVGGEANVPLVCILVADPDAGVSTNASHTLGRIASAAGAPCLVEAARSENETIRLTALKNLQLVPAVDQLADLEKIVRKARAAGDETTAALGIAAIGRAGGPEAESFLEGMIGARETRIRIASAVALFALGNDEAGTVAEEVFEQTEGPWGINDHVEWGLLAQRIDGRTLPLVERAVEEGNPSLREKVLGALMDARSPDAVFLLEHVQLERWGDTTLEYRHPGSGKVYGFTSAVLGEMGRRGDGAGRRDLLGRLLDSQDAFMRALGLRFLLPSDGEWAASRASGALGSETDPWLRLEAVRALAVLAAGGSGTTGGGA